MNPEDRLRTALHDVADDTEVTSGSFDRIERKTARARRRRAAVGGGLAAVALVAVAVGVPLALRDGGGESVEIGPASDDRDPTTTTSTTDTVEPQPAPVEEHAFVWPAAGDATYANPRAVVQAFATEYLGVVDPVVRPIGADSYAVEPWGDPGRGAPREGPATVVRVDSVDGHPTVVGAVSTNLLVDAPVSGADASTPLTVSGRARNLYEGNVIVEVRDGAGGVVAVTNTTAAGSGPQLAAFSVDVSFDAPGGRGAIVVKSDSGIEGTPEATVVPVTFGQQTEGETTEVTVYLQDPRGDFVPATRTIPATTGVLRASVLQLLRGTTPEEEARGLTSPFSGNGEALLGVTITEDGTAVVNFDVGFPAAIAGQDGAAVLASLDRTVFQFPNVTWVRYEVGGECVSFAGIDTGLLCERRSRDEY